MDSKKESVNYKITEETQKKLQQVWHYMSITEPLRGNKVSYDIVLSTLADTYLISQGADVKKKIEYLLEEQSKIAIIREEIKEYFRQQNNNIEELIGAIMKQNNSAEFLKEIELIKNQTDTIKTQNAGIISDIKSIREFNAPMNHAIRNLYESVNALTNEVGKLYSDFSEEIVTNIKRQFGIAVPIILFNMLRELCMLSKKVVTKELSKEKEDEAIKYTKEEIQKTISNYKNLYNSSSQYSDEDVDKLIDKYSMKEQSKK